MLYFYFKESDVRQSKMVHIQYWLSNLSACLENLFFPGIIFGWPSLQSVLEREGYFSYLCRNSSSALLDNVSETMTLSNRCNEQQSNFNLIFTITVASMNGLAFPLGYFLDRFGTWVFRSILSLLYTIGIVLLAISTANTSVLLYPAIVLIGISGLGLLLSNFQLANLTRSYRGVILTLLHGIRDSSVLLFFLVKLAYDSGTDLYFIFKILCLITIYQWIRTFVLMPRKLIPFPLQDSTLEYGYKEWICFRKRQVTEHFIPVSLLAVGAPKKIADKIIDLRKHRIKKTVSFLCCLKQALFWTNAFHYSVITFRVNIIFGIIQPWLRSFADSDDVSKLTDDFGIVLLFCGLVAPLNGILFDCLVRRFLRKTEINQVATLKACFVSMTITTTLATLLSIKMAIFNPYGVYVFELLARSFVLGGNVAFIAANFPADHIGKLFGLTNFISGVISLLQYALLQVAFAVDPTFYFINIGLTFIVILTLIHPVAIFLKIRKQAQVEQDEYENEKSIKRAFQFANIFGVALAIPNIPK